MKKVLKDQGQFVASQLLITTLCVQIKNVMCASSLCDACKIHFLMCVKIRYA